MRLYVDDKANLGKRIYITYHADTRAALEQKMGFAKFNFSCDKPIMYSIQEVKAEPDWKNPALPGIIVGAIIGLFFLDITFMIVMTCIGGIMSELQNQPDFLRAKKFNES